MRQWAEAFRWYLRWLELVRRSGGGARSLAEEVRMRKRKARIPVVPHRSEVMPLVEKLENMKPVVSHENAPRGRNWKVKSKK